jgi:hypothetical protein
MSDDRSGLDGVWSGTTGSREEIVWAAVLPAEDITGWLSLDFEAKYMKVNPFVAHPHAEPAGR